MIAVSATSRFVGPHGLPPGSFFKTRVVWSHRKTERCTVIQLLLAIDNATNTGLQLLMLLTALGEQRDFRRDFEVAGRGLGNGLGTDLVDRAVSSVWIASRDARPDLPPRMTFDVSPRLSGRTSYPSSIGIPFVVHSGKPSSAATSPLPSRRSLRAGAGGPPRAKSRLEFPGVDLGSFALVTLPAPPCTVSEV